MGIKVAEMLAKLEGYLDYLRAMCRYTREFIVTQQEKPPPITVTSVQLKPVVTVHGPNFSEFGSN